MIVIVDNGMGNFGSIRNMLKRLGFAAEISRDHDRIRAAEKIILSGVGAFGAGMNQLEQLGLLDVLDKKVIGGSTPVLGICLGMQLFTKCSEESPGVAGLGWIECRTVRFDIAPETSVSKLRIPHMGWNTISVRRDDSLLSGLDDEPRFYFVHSYHVVCDERDDVLATCSYGRDFVCAVRKGCIFGSQFHPEKSHRFGMAVLSNFASLT